MYISDIGTNAGIIWDILSCRESMTIREIGELTHIKGPDISLALGWLAREDKISFEDMDDGVRISLKYDSPDIYY